MHYVRRCNDFAANESTKPKNQIGIVSRKNIVAVTFDYWATPLLLQNPENMTALNVWILLHTYL